MNLEDHIADGGEHALPTRPPQQARCACGTWGHVGTFRDVRDRPDIEGDWQGFCCWSKEMQAARAMAEAARPDMLSNDPAEAEQQLKIWKRLPDWRKARRVAYLRGLQSRPGRDEVKAWTAEEQLEALIDAVGRGDRTRLDALIADQDAVKAALPKPVQGQGSPPPQGGRKE